MKVIIYTGDQPKLGGVETLNKNLCKRLSQYYDVTFVCDWGNLKSLIEISKYAKVIINKGQEIKGDICIHAQAWTKKPQNIKAKRHVQMIHGDYEWMKNALNYTYKKDPVITDHVAVGETVSKQFKKMTELDSTVIYNLLDIDNKPEPVLKLITVTRIAREKGFTRMEKLARILKKAGRKFIWHIYGDGTDRAFEKKVRQSFADIQEVVFMGVNDTDVISYIANSDYLVGLSDAEGFSYSVYEALSVGVPCIITNYKTAQDQIEDGVNGYILDMKLGNLDIDKLYSKIPNKFIFKERSTEQDWINFIGGNPKKRIKTRKKLAAVNVEVKKSYMDISLNRRLVKGEKLTMLAERGIELSNKNLIKIESLVEAT